MKCSRTAVGGHHKKNHLRESRQSLDNADAKQVQNIRQKLLRACSTSSKFGYESSVKSFAESWEGGGTGSLESIRQTFATVEQGGDVAGIVACHFK